MNCRKLSEMVSAKINGGYLFRNSSSMVFIWIVLTAVLLGAISPLLASDPDDILASEPDRITYGRPRDDQVVALKKEYEFIPDKLNYDYGEIVRVTYDIHVDKTSRGYMPNRTYYLLSPNVTGHQISGSESLCWRILKSDIDTLEVITDDRSLHGEFTLQLIHYRDKPQVVQWGNDGFTYMTPIDTTSVKTNKKKSTPPLIQFTAYRVAPTNTGDNVYQHSSGNFIYDQQCGIPLEGKVQIEQTNKWLERATHQK